jgi:CubicO group peptidase (beta-lactamase class C family)
MGAVSPSQGGEVTLLSQSPVQILNENTQFFIGSISKQFTAFMMLKALHAKNQDNTEAVISDLRAPLSQTLEGSQLIEQIMDFTKRPDFSDKKPATWLETTTIHELLSHTSGLGSYSSVESLTENCAKGAAESAIPLDHIQIVQSAKFLGKKDYSYSNTNYLFAAKIIEQLTGMSFTEYSKQLTEEFGLESTVNVESGTFAAAAQEYGLKNLHLNPADMLTDDVYNAYGTGSIVSTLHDLLNWSVKFASHPYHELMAKKYAKINPEEDSFYGYGVAVDSTAACGDVREHDGSIGSYYCYLGYWPIQGLHLAFLSCDENVSQSIMPPLGELGLFDSCS